MVGDLVRLSTKKGALPDFKIISSSPLTLDKNIGRDLLASDIIRYDILRDDGPSHEHLIKNGFIETTKNNYNGHSLDARHSHYLKNNFGSDLKIKQIYEQFYLLGGEKLAEKNVDTKEINIILEKEINDQQTGGDVGRFIDMNKINDDVYVLTDKNKILYKNL
jgi:hypothetical protein